MSPMWWYCAQMAGAVVALALFITSFATGRFWPTVLGWVVLLLAWLCRSLGRRAERRELPGRWSL